ncbi:hypothetical protein AVEN_14901-1 [Araneus ventricosus]|uniref:Uncharacterized protein n=1 Tax=Araneus ventricosus TaxID=182803 RepID=A0A4Y2F5T9_ARAVE|nr:hypothetical protein AVEN_14901-1 [Araneus ventricosus]
MRFIGKSHGFTLYHTAERRDGQCFKSFPKQFKDDTEENVNGYPIYRRRATELVQVGKYSIDNRWVVPYNPWLLQKFNAHINVEVCASVKSVKYLYKYVYKGHDVASKKIQKEGALDHDEILSFVEGRWPLNQEWDFGAWLLDIGEKKSGSTIQLPLQCYPSIQDPIHQLYSDIDFSSVIPQELKGRAILTVNNERSMEINNKVLKSMPGNETIYKAVDMIMSEDP